MTVGTSLHSYIGGGCAGTARKGDRHTGGCCTALYKDGLQGLTIQKCFGRCGCVQVHVPGDHPFEFEGAVFGRGGSDLLPLNGYFDPRHTLAVCVQHLTKDLSRSRMRLIKGYDQT